MRFKGSTALRILMSLLLLLGICISDGCNRSTSDEQADLADWQIEAIHSAEAEIENSVGREKNPNEQIADALEVVETQRANGLVEYYQVSYDSIHVRYSYGVTYLFQVSYPGFDVYGGSNTDVAPIAYRMGKLLHIKTPYNNLADVLYGIDMRGLNNSKSFIFWDYFDMNVTLELLKFAFTNLDLVLWEGHGYLDTVLGPTLMTGEHYSTKTASSQDLRTERVIELSTGYYGITSRFIEYYYSPGSFEGCLFLFNSCHTGETRLFADALLSKGASTVLAFDYTVLVPYADAMINTVLKEMLRRDSSGGFYVTAWDALSKAWDTHGNSDQSNLIDFFRDTLFGRARGAMLKLFGDGSYCFSRLGNTQSDPIPVEPENGNETELMLRVGTMTYFVSNMDNELYPKILMIDEDEDATAQILYTAEYETGLIYIYLTCGLEGFLFFREFHYEVYDDGCYAYTVLKSINLSSTNKEAKEIPLHIKDGQTVPSRLAQSYQRKYGERLTPGRLFDENCFTIEQEGRYLYTCLGDPSLYDKLLLFRIDCTSGEVDYIEGDTLDADERWYIKIAKGDQVYLLKTVDKTYEGLYTAIISDLSTKKLIDLSGERFFSGKIVDNKLYYLISDYSTDEPIYFLQQYDLASTKQAVILETPRVEFNIVGDTIFYSVFFSEELRSCRLDGSNDRLVEEYSDIINLNRICISGQWVYFRQYGYDVWQRLKPDGRASVVYPISIMDNPAELPSS